MLRIGITGGIGAGKSTVSRVFQALGVPVYDSDTRARWVMEHDALLRAQVQEAFGNETYDGSGHLNRPLLAQLVFGSPDRLAQLNGLVHPRVGLDFSQWADAQAQAGHAYVLKEAALLFESGAYQQLDQVMVVVAPLAARLTRLLRRDPHRTSAEAQAIIGKQLSDEAKISRAHHVLHNDDQHPVLPQVLALHQLFKAQAEHGA